MNESGRAVLGLMTHHRIKPEELLVVFDDADLALGVIRFRAGGGSGGHNGIKSIMAGIGPDFNRLKIGIGRTGGTEEGLTSHVLGAFTKEESEKLEEIIERAVAGIGEFVRNGILAAAAKHNPTPARPPAADGP